MQTKSPNLLRKTLMDMADVYRELACPLRGTALIVLLFAACMAPGIFLAGWLKGIFIHQAWYLSAFLPLVVGSLFSFFSFMFVVFFIGNIREQRNSADQGDAECGGM